MSSTVIVDGQKLRKLRESLALSQEGLEFACSRKKGCSVSVATIKRAELGNPLSRRTVARLAQFFSVPIDELLLCTDPRQPPEGFVFDHDQQSCLLVWVNANPRTICRQIESVLLRFNPLFTQSTGNSLVCAVPYVKGKKQYLALLNSLYDIIGKLNEQASQVRVSVQQGALHRSEEPQWLLEGSVFEGFDLNASRLPLGAISVSESLYRLSRSCFHFQALDQAPQFYQLLMPSVNSLSPRNTMGRESEFQQWVHAVDVLSSSGKSSIFTVSGLVGSGKTHTLGYFKQEAKASTWRQICLDFEMFQPSSSLVKDVLYPELAQAGLLEIEPKNRSEAIEQKQAPSLIVLDNLHLADTNSFTLLLDIMHETRKHPVLWLIGCAPTRSALAMLDEFRHTGLRNTQLSLEPLQFQSVKDLIHDQQIFSDEFLQAMHVHSAGNPYFFQELVTLALEGESALRPFFEYQFETLDDTEKLVLSTLACSLHNLTVDELLRLPHVSMQVIQSLQALSWVRLSFRNTVSFVLDEAKGVVQRAMSARVKSAANRWLAAQINELAVQDETSLWLIGEYCLGAQAFEEAARAFFEYGQMWMRQYSYQQAIHWLHRGLEALSMAQGCEAVHLLMSDLRLALARINSVSRGWVSQSSMVAYQQCLGLASRHHCTLRHCVALTGVWVTQLMAMEFKTSEKTAYDMLEQAKQGNDPFSVALAHSCLSNTHFWLGQHEKALEHAEQACLCYQDCKDEHLAEGIGFNPLGLACCFGALSASVKCDYQLLAFFRQYHSIEVIAKSPFNKAIVLQGDIWCLYHQRDPEQVLVLSGQLLKLSEKHNFPFYKGVAMLFLGWAQGVLHPEQATEQLNVIEEGYNYWLASSGDQIAHSLYALIKAEIFRLADQKRQATDLVQSAVDLAHQKHEDCYLAPLYAKLGQLHKSQEIAQEQGASLFMQPEWCVSS
jgi:tetratricopeptide (TPR) repeat protein/transcriptional regulator with XRE-family HTH domain